MSDTTVGVPKIVTVIPDSADTFRGQVKFGGKTVACCLGRAGVRQDKVEGDGATPVGRFPLKRVLYRADRIGEPLTTLPTTKIKVDDGWCDDPTDRSYNRPVKLPYPARAERLWRDDRRYDIVVVIGHNDDPVVESKGSAVFIHLMDENEGPTAGCIALESGDMTDFLGCVGPETSIEILEPTLKAS